MNIFERNYDYDTNYQSYLDWKEKQAELNKEYDMAEEYERDLQREKEEVETTGERCVREAQEEDVRQLAQVSVGGVYRYELEWLPETHEIRAEVDHFRDGSPVYLWYPDYMGTTEVLSKLLNTPEEQIRITGLTFFTKGDMLVALNYEQRQFMNNTWRDYTADGTAMQFNVEIACPNNCYDAACDGTHCEFKPVRPHGVDGTQCDCSDCTLDYGLCSCGCAGDFQKHGEWLEEREKQRQAFVHETAEPLGGTLADYMKDYMSDEEDSPKPKLVIEDDDESTSSVESVEEKESRLWSDFKLAIMVAMTALMIGAYLCKVACF
jgi:hypothetical protein